MVVLSGWRIYLNCKLGGTTVLMKSVIHLPMSASGSFARFWFCAGNRGGSINPASVVSPSALGHPDLLPGSLDTCPLRHCIGWRIQLVPSWSFFFWSVILSFSCMSAFWFLSLQKIVLQVVPRTEDSGAEHPCLVIWQDCLLCASVSSTVEILMFTYLVLFL